MPRGGYALPENRDCTETPGFCALNAAMTCPNGLGRVPAPFPINVPDTGVAAPLACADGVDVGAPHADTITTAAHTAGSRNHEPRRIASSLRARGSSNRDYRSRRHRRKIRTAPALHTWVGSPVGDVQHR